MSIWKRGAQISAVISVLVLIANASQPAPELIGVTVTSFLFWWVVAAAVVWLWRKIKG